MEETISYSVQKSDRIYLSYFSRRNTKNFQNFCIENLWTILAFNRVFKKEFLPIPFKKLSFESMKILCIWKN